MKFCFILIFITTFLTQSSFAELTVLPESRHHLYEIYSQYIEQQNMIVWKGSNRYWATVSVTAPIVGNNDSPLHQQFLFHISGNDSMHVNDGGGVFTETLDTRLGFFYESGLPLFSDFRFSVGIQHVSGHTVDGADNPELDTLNLGNNTFRLTLIKDFEQKIRAGFVLAPVINAIPPGYPTYWTLNLEYFPLSTSEDSHSFKPFIASSLTHRLAFDRGTWTYQFHIGYAMGSHFLTTHTHTIRLVLGYYSGIDPRTKYAQFERSRVAFGFLGAIFNL